MSILRLDLVQTPEEALADPDLSDWLKSAIQHLIAEDPETAFNEAVELRNIMEKHFVSEVVTHQEE